MEKIRQKMRKARGFTLVELLIVIIIIGILAGALLLAAGAGTSKAKATTVVSNMRNLKGAALMYYADYNAWPTTYDSNNTPTSLDQYLDKPLKAVAGERYQILSNDSGMSVDVKVTDLDGTVWSKIQQAKDTYGVSADTTDTVQMQIK